MSRTVDINIEKQYPLPTPQEVLEELPGTPEQEETVYRFREDIRKIVSRKDKRIIAAVGPCSIDSLPAALEFASRMKPLQEKVADKICLVMRTYFEKPRTTVGWKGLAYDPDMNQSFNIEKGLRLARKLLLELTDMKIPAATEFLEPTVPQYFSDLISWAAIGARTTESQTHRQLASGLSMPVGFKNSTDGSISIAVDAICTARAKHSFLGVIHDGRTGVFQTKGNPDCHVVLRGGQHLPNYGSEYVAFAVELMRKRGLIPSVMIDCSHGNSMRKPENQPEVLMDVVSQICAGEEAICGIMMENYLRTGSQKIVSGCKVLPGISVTDPCLGWDETEDAITNAYNALPKI